MSAAIENHCLDLRLGLRVVAAAVKLKDGRIICGVRHFDPLMRAHLPEEIKEAQALLAGHEEGFVTNSYHYVSREDAWKIAVCAQQIDFKQWKGVYGTLYSEDLW